MADLEDDLGSVMHHDPTWISFNGGWIHANNVLFYFNESPFSDRTSNNQAIISQFSNSPQVFEVLGTRKRFEAKLAQMTGVQYIVAHDPLETNSHYKGPDGTIVQSDVWVIRRQTRFKNENKMDDISITGYYYIMNGCIFQAPSVANVLGYRLLNTITAVDQVCSKAAGLPVFSVAHGHTYQKPVQKVVPNVITSTVASKAATPMPETQSTADKSEPEKDTRPSSDSSARLLREALHLTRRYGKEYMDEAPLIGEPGSFRIDRKKDNSTNASQLSTVSKSFANTSKVGTPAPISRIATPPPVLQTDVPPAQSKKSSAKSPSSSDPLKPKRRKSKAAISTP